MTNQGNKHPKGGDKNKSKHQPAKNNPGKKKGARNEESAKESELDPDSPEKRIQIDYDPEGTKKKIPH